MKSFKVSSDGNVLIDGVVYSQTPTNDVKVRGKVGTIHSINISGKGQFFPISGEFNDGMVCIVDSTTEVLDVPTTKKAKLAKTELVDKSSPPVGVDGKPLKGKKGLFTLNPDR